MLSEDASAAVMFELKEWSLKQNSQFGGWLEMWSWK